MTTAERLVAALRASGRRLAVAESLTGGAVSAAVVAVPGASAVLRGSVTAYDAEVKSEVLGVAPEVIAGHGVVSAPVAIAMARGAARLLRADVAVATTGVAGPGPSDGVAAGRVVVAAVRGDVVAVRSVLLGGGRALVRAAAVELALGVALGVVDEVVPVVADGNTARL
ncbi:CinA family protein [Serinibacter arcticus]|uniref:C-terminal domain of CinA type S n=1 Tax=Serinibacter arcticus TaxID=1655435 RepID=A0A4Z1E8Y3_9MICO|nr:CinA family protein [Serinibacter arcticus]TGO05901.1 C-terminal domain of CinA type S [Serinibacter arcticus]